MIRLFSGPCCPCGKSSVVCRQPRTQRSPIGESTPVHQVDNLVLHLERSHRKRGKVYVRVSLLEFESDAPRAAFQNHLADWRSPRDHVETRTPKHLTF